MRPQLQKLGEVLRSTTWSEAMVLLRSRDRASSCLLAVQEVASIHLGLGSRIQTPGHRGWLSSISRWAQKRLKKSLELRQALGLPDCRVLHDG